MKKRNTIIKQPFECPETTYPPHAFGSPLNRGRNKAVAKSRDSSKESLYVRSFLGGLGAVCAIDGGAG